MIVHLVNIRVFPVLIELYFILKRKTVRTEEVYIFYIQIQDLVENKGYERLTSYQQLHKI